LVAETVSTSVATLIVPLLVVIDKPVPPVEFNEPPLVVMLAPDEPLVSIVIPPFAVTGFEISTPPAVAVNDRDAEPASVTAPFVMIADAPLAPVAIE
jgi:hypothetical protein